MTKALAFTIANVGCYADGANGHNHLRSVLANLLEDITDDSSVVLVESLRGPMPDDCGDELDALDILQDATDSRLTWTLDNGELMLREDDDFV